MSDTDSGPWPYGDATNTEVPVTTPYDDLATRLRNTPWVCDDRLHGEAADRIKDLAAELAAVRTALTEACDAFEECTGDYAEDLAAEDLARWRRLAGSTEPARVRAPSTPEPQPRMSLARLRPPGAAGDVGLQVALVQASEATA